MICLCAILGKLLPAWLVLAVLSRSSLSVGMLRGVSHVFLNIIDPCMVIQPSFLCKRIISPLAWIFWHFFGDKKHVDGCFVKNNACE